MGQGKKKKKRATHSPAIVEPHNKKGKVIQIAAQLRSPRICFSIFHLPTCTKSHLCTCALRLFILVSWAGPIQLFRGMQMVTAAHNAAVQRHLVMTGSLGPLSVCCRDYCNISGLQYPHLSPPPVPSPLSHDVLTLAGNDTSAAVSSRLGFI